MTFIAIVTAGLQFLIWRAKHSIGPGMGEACTGSYCREGLVCRSDPGGLRGHCTRPCDSDGDCPDRWSCAVTGSAGQAICRPPATGGFGARCEDGLDCGSGQCLQLTAKLLRYQATLCGQPCGPGGECPQGATCEALGAEGAHSCFPYEEAERLAASQFEQRLRPPGRE